MTLKQKAKNTKRFSGKRKKGEKTNSVLKFEKNGWEKRGQTKIQKVGLT